MNGEYDFDFHIFKVVNYLFSKVFKFKFREFLIISLRIYLFSRLKVFEKRKKYQKPKLKLKGLKIFKEKDFFFFFNGKQIVSNKRFLLLKNKRLLRTDFFLWKNN